MSHIARVCTSACLRLMDDLAGAMWFTTFLPCLFDTCYRVVAAVCLGILSLSAWSFSGQLDFLYGFGSADDFLAFLFDLFWGFMWLADQKSAPAGPLEADVCEYVRLNAKSVVIFASDEMCELPEHVHTYYRDEDNLDHEDLEDHGDHGDYGTGAGTLRMTGRMTRARRIVSFANWMSQQSHQLINDSFVAHILSLVSYTQCITKK